MNECDFNSEDLDCMRRLLCHCNQVSIGIEVHDAKHFHPLMLDPTIGHHFQSEPEIELGAILKFIQEDEFQAKPDIWITEEKRLSTPQIAVRLELEPDSISIGLEFLITGKETIWRKAPEKRYECWISLRRKKPDSEEDDDDRDNCDDFNDE